MGHRGVHRARWGAMRARREARQCAALGPLPAPRTVWRPHACAQVRSIAPDTSGQWLLSGSDDGTVRVWEVRTGRCFRCWDLGTPVHAVAWCPDASVRLASAAAGNRCVLLPALGLDGEAGVDERTLQRLRDSGAGAAGEAGAPLPAAAARAAADAASEAAAAAARPAASTPASAPAVAEPEASTSAGAVPEGSVAEWVQRRDGGLDLVHRHAVKSVAWHARGDYFATVSPTGNTQARAGLDPNPKTQKPRNPKPGSRGTRGL
jgi:ribosome biogenesis protein ERB1